jgi:V/A-type H+/Na+-transporting ATPase subunit I
VSLRPAAARWFELLTARDDAAPALEVLAHTGTIELETLRKDMRLLSLRDMRMLVEQYRELYRHYHVYWPSPDLADHVRAGGPDRTLQHSLGQLRNWEREATPRIGRLESLLGTQRDLQLFAGMLRVAGNDSLDYGQLAGAGAILAARLFVLPPGFMMGRVSGGLLVNRYATPRHTFLLAVGECGAVEKFGQGLSAFKGRTLPLPDFVSGDATQALRQVERRMHLIDAQAAQLRQRIEVLNGQYELARLLGNMQRLDWFLRHVDCLPVSHNFAWFTGWTSDLDGHQLERVLATGGVRALIHFPPPPADAKPPMLLRNPRWGRPFEPFVAMLGAPAAGEVDPSSLLALLVPLLFGYMFGDLGQGLVLVVTGLLLRRRWPVLDLLVINGVAAMLFGIVFGSVFGREDLLPALWLHPLEQPLLVLQVPLAGGVLVLLLGLLLRALQYHWRGEAALWWRLEAPQLLLYVAVLALLVSSHAWPLVAVILLWYLAACWQQRHREPGFSMAGALGSLLENLVQLLINTLSFVRVGAFALAHAGLALAFATLAEMPESQLLAALVLLIGNLVIIVLEGLVVTIQTTRLVLFEFFIRFLRAEGRVFHPLAAPAPHPEPGSQ